MVKTEPELSMDTVAVQRSVILKGRTMSLRKTILTGLVSALGVAFVPHARGVEVPFTEHVISTVADGARSVFETDVDGVQTPTKEEEALS